MCVCVGGGGGGGEECMCVLGGSVPYNDTCHARGYFMHTRGLYHSLVSVYLKINYRGLFH